MSSLRRGGLLVWHWTMKNADKLYLIATKLYLDALHQNDVLGIIIAASSIDKIKEEIKASKLSVP